MRRIFLTMLFFAGALFPLLGQATCTQADLDERLYPALQYRLRCLDGLSRLDVFRMAATPHSQRISEARIGNASAKQAMVVICRETKALIAIADDVLAGGDGLSELKKSPWQGVTPDDVLKRRNEVMQLCKGQLVCYQKAMADYEKEMGALDGRARMGRITAVEYIEQMHALFGRVLDSMREKK
jgi:hypothetical protein